MPLPSHTVFLYDVNCEEKHVKELSDEYYCRRKVNIFQGIRTKNI